MELIGSQIAVAYATSTFMEWLKSRSWFPLLQKDASVLNRSFAALMALLTGLGIHAATDWQAATGVFTVTISGITALGITHGVLAWIQQFAMQTAIYKLLVKQS